MLVPLVSFGLAAFAPFLYLVVRRRTRARLTVLAVYLAVDVLAFALIAGKESGHPAAGHAAGGVFLLLMIAGTAHAAALVTRRDVDIAAEGTALDRARKDAALRAQARALAARDPRLALDAHVGRPDLPGHANDGGLVDVNHASATAIAALPGVGRELAERIVSTRESVGGFSSLADLCVALDLTPQQLDEAADRLLFLVPPPAI
jgi:hypothetical protein